MSKKKQKTTSFRIRNSLIKIFLQYSESPSLHSNLVKSFLTSIKFNFDSLSRKIKNPCLVINFNFYTKEDIHMWNIKKILIAVLSFSLLFSINCKNDGKTGGGGAGGGSSASKLELVGNWQQETNASSLIILILIIMVI